MSKFMVLLYQSEALMPQPGTPAFDTQNAAYNTVYEEFAKRGAFVVGDPFYPSSASTSVQVRGGQTTTTSGPAVASSAEQIIGYYVLEAESQAAAVELAAMIPAAAVGTVEVRPIFQM